MGAGGLGGRFAAGHEHAPHRESATVAAGTQSRRDPRARGGDSGGGSTSGSSVSDSDGGSDIGDGGSVASASSSSDQDFKDLPLSQPGTSGKVGPTDGVGGVGVESSSEDDLPLAQIAQR